MNDNNKPRIGRPANQDGHKYKIIGVSGTPAEIDAVLFNLTPRQRMDAMLAALDARNDESEDFAATAHWHDISHER